MARGSKRKAANPRPSSTRKRSSSVTSSSSVIVLSDSDSSEIDSQSTDTLSVSDEITTPSEAEQQQTVIQFLEVERDEAIKKIQEFGHRMIAQFREDVIKAKENLKESLSEPLISLPEPKVASVQANKDELPAVEVKPTRNDQPEKETTKQKNGDQKIIRLSCTAGYYVGQTFTLVILAESNRIAHIGRSSGKKYKAPHGLSLTKDPEISTSHAEIRWSQEEDLLYITDQNSTNGTKINGRNIKSRTSVRLDFSKPVKATFGSTDLTLTI